MNRTPLVLLMLLGAVALLAAPARAWKPPMHVYLAEQALADAVDDGQLEFVRLDTGARVRFPVDPELLAALRRFPGHYRAGVLGPDAYPDIATGQSVIHVDEGAGNGPGGTDAWLQYLWLRSLHPSLQGDTRLRVRAFVAGYLTHGAGDMFGHTFVNAFAGGEFAYGANALRHIVLEGTVARRSPQPASRAISIDGIEDWMYTTMVDARRGTYLAERLLIGDTRTRSIPYLFSKMRDRLAAEVSDYRRHRDDAFRVAEGPANAYREAWIRDIDRGLRAWPRFSHDLARELTLHGDSGPDTARIDQIVRTYVTDHLLSMLGAPDFVGLAAGAIARITQAISEAILPEAVRNRIRTALLDFLCENAFGKSYSELRDLLTRPDSHFDRVMASSFTDRTTRSPLSTTLADFHRDHLKTLVGQAMTPAQTLAFPPAWNTLVQSKLILLDPTRMGDLCRAVGANARTLPDIRLDPCTLRLLGIADNGFAAPGNLMLGYNQMFDGANQWHANPQRFPIVSAGAYPLLFKPQTGETPIRNATAPPPPATAPFACVTLTIRRVRAVGHRIDIGGKPDFYPKVYIAGERFVRDDRGDDADIHPNWTFVKQARRNGTVTVTLSIWDEDGSLRGSDDAVDIHPGSGRQLSLTLDPRTGRITGSVNGQAGQELHARGDGDDNAEIWFTLSVE